MLCISHDEDPKTGLFFRVFQASDGKCNAGRWSATYARRGTSTTPYYWFLLLRQIKIGFWMTLLAFNKLWTDIHVNFTCIWKVFHVFCIWIFVLWNIKKTTTTEDKKVKKVFWYLTIYEVILRGEVTCWSLLGLRCQKILPPESVPCQAKLNSMSHNHLRFPALIVGYMYSLRDPIGSFEFARALWLARQRDDLGITNPF